MIQHVGATLWDVFSLCRGLRFLLLFVVAIIWLRLLLPVAEAVLSPEKTDPDSLHPPAAQSNADVSEAIEPSSQPSNTQTKLRSQEECSEDQWYPQFHSSHESTSPIRLTTTRSRRILGEWLT